MRKMIGTFLFVLGTTAYFLIAIALAIALLPRVSLPGQIACYAGATVIWFFFAALLIKWMSKPDPLGSVNSGPQALSARSRRH
jgi:membrane protein implicated in regulation of membrane protease activity